MAKMKQEMRGATGKIGNKTCYQWHGAYRGHRVLWEKVLEKTLFFQRFQKAGRHGFVILARIADVGEDLGERLLVVDLAELEVLG